MSPCWSSFSSSRFTSLKTQTPSRSGLHQSGCAQVIATSSVAATRRFEFVPYEAEYSGGSSTTITCDGLVRGAALQLTHWTGNKTPEEYYADTSTEIALKFVSSPEAQSWGGAVVLNNHFDTDGVLSVWALLDPIEAIKRKKLLIEAAEAGDFDEWPSNEGVWLDAAFSAIREQEGSDEAAYHSVFSQLPSLLDDIGKRRDLWGPVQDSIDEAMQALADGRVTHHQHGCIGVVLHSPGVPQIPGPVLSKLWRDNNTVQRYLLAFEEAQGNSYKYMCPGHAWATTVTRPRLSVPDGGAMASALGPVWKCLNGLTGVVESVHTLDISPLAAAGLLLEAEARHAAKGSIG
eukprot:CAMPEP_0117654252 /NCGR_PEP_ID=MMETSP0804-20121206/3644_1 /TAXON_ID=1074897 /ORGANISM="Tetraselmis astigmatica, Strain CCMP880" /LENGTH=346 /DNA_ID=CAMNT_0005460519 /DNA_START=1183 /DNA_END=2223 /DNA_ORIENTATION=-